MLRESGSHVRYQGNRRESGSVFALPRRDGTPRGSRNDGPPRRPAESANDRAPDRGQSFTDYSRETIPPSGFQLQDASNILIALLIFLAGCVFSWLFLRGGVIVPPISPGRTIWENQIELCCNLIQQMDAVILDAQGQEWEKCCNSLEALKGLNGQRTVLLNNEINRAAIVFLASATYCVQRKDCTSHFADMKACYHAAIDSMRMIANTEPMSPEIHRLLDASHQQLRAIRLKESGAA